jgi:hypothetical protein
LYLGGLWFESRPMLLLFWLSLSQVSSVPSGKYQITKGEWITNASFQIFSIHHYHSMLDSKLSIYWQRRKLTRKTRNSQSSIQLMTDVHSFVSELRFYCEGAVKSVINCFCRKWQPLECRKRGVNLRKCYKFLEGCSRLGCDSVYSGRNLETFGRNLQGFITWRWRQLPLKR